MLACTGFSDMGPRTKWIAALGLISSEVYFMKLAGFFLLLAGWVIVLAALTLLPSALPRAVFVAAGVAVEVLGFVLVARSHAAHPREGW
jgi:hypothetical protein